MSSVYDTVPPPAVQNTMEKRPRVAVAIDGTSEHNFWSDLTLDVARGGVFVATYHSLPLGTPVEIELGLAGEEPTILRGVVRWARGHADGSDGSAGIGIALVDVGPEANARIQRFAETVRQPLLFEVDDTITARRRSRPSIH